MLGVATVVAGVEMVMLEKDILAFVMGTWGLAVETWALFPETLGSVAVKVGLVVKSWGLAAESLDLELALGRVAAGMPGLVETPVRGSRAVFHPAQLWKSEKQGRQGIFIAHFPITSSRCLTISPNSPQTPYHSIISGHTSLTPTGLERNFANQRFI